MVRRSPHHSPSCQNLQTSDKYPYSSQSSSCCTSDSFCSLCIVFIGTKYSLYSEYTSSTDCGWLDSAQLSGILIVYHNTRFTDFISMTFLLSAISHRPKPVILFNIWFTCSHVELHMPSSFASSMDIYGHSYTTCKTQKNTSQIPAKSILEQYFRKKFICPLFIYAIFI